MDRDQQRRRMEPRRKPLGGRIVGGTAIAAYDGGATVDAVGADGTAWSNRVDASGSAVTGWFALGGRCVGGTSAALQ
jgi:hypothetical protein